MVATGAIGAATTPCITEANAKPARPVAANKPLIISNPPPTGDHIEAVQTEHCPALFTKSHSSHDIQKSAIRSLLKPHREGASGRRATVSSLFRQVPFRGGVDAEFL